ncbi:MAG: rhodanese-like domain-containing protein, partial [Candidatus Dormibacteraceae bacterium]
MSEKNNGYANPKALVDTQWAADHGKDPNHRLIEVDVTPANYAKGHLPGAVGWDWRRDLQDPQQRDIASAEDLAAKLGQSGVTPDTTILLYG